MSTSGVVGGKTAVLPGFFKKERYGGNGAAVRPHIIVVLPGLCKHTTPLSTKD